MMSSDDEFEDTYDGIAEEEAVEPLEVEGSATMPSGNENKPTKSICKALTTHLSLLKHKVSELSTYLDGREAVQAIDDHEIDTIQLKAGWIETKFNKILTQWEDYLDTDHDDAEYDRAEPIFKECGELSAKIRSRADAFITKTPRAVQATASGPTIQTSSYHGPPRTNDMLKPKKQLDENMSLEAALHWFKTYKNHWDLNSNVLAQQSVSVKRGILENDIDPHMAYALGAHSKIKDDSSVEDCLKVLKEIFWRKIQYG